MNEVGTDGPLLIHILRHPDAAASLDDASWGLLLRQARSANVVGRTLMAVDSCIPSAQWPLRAQQVFLAEKNVARHRSQSLHWEVEGLSRTLALVGVRPILLKGAAYVLDEQSFAQYRHFGDIDILVPRPKLDEVEQLLTVNGWLTTKSDPYDQQYFRRWMHELPPMQHLHRGTSLDVHHAILPLTARFRPDSRLLLDSARQARGLALVDVLSPVDMFLHAAAHLFFEGEHENALRNLLDLHDLLERFTCAQSFTVPELVDRSFDLNLSAVLALASRYLERIFRLAVAQEISKILRDRGMVLRYIRWNDWLFDAIFLGFHSSHRPPLISLARKTLYLRGHVLRMPLGLLAWHLLRKARRSAPK